MMRGVHAPRGLGEHGRRAWRRYAATLEGFAVDVEAVAEPLQRLCQVVDDLARARDLWTQHGQVPVGKGSMGQLVENPLIKVQAGFRREILELEGALGLTVAARSSQRPAGWARGHARAADRAARPVARRKGSNVVPIAPSLELRRLLGDADAQ